MNIINELTLGNQVIIVKNDKQEMVVTVAAIHRNKIAYHERPDRLTWVTANNIKPLPITKEFLDRNFVPVEDNPVIDIEVREEENIYTYETPIKWKYGNESYHYNMSFQGGKCDIHMVSVPSFFYVHNLQNFLKLCNSKIVLK